MAQEIPDYSEHVSKPSADQLARLSQLALEQHQAEQRVEAAKEALAQAQEALRQVAEVAIPELMDEVGMEEFKTRSGLRIKVDEKLRVSIRRDRVDDACEYMHEVGSGSLVKRFFTIKFGRDEEKWARKFEADLRRRKRQLQVDRTKKVEPSTLKKWVNDRLKVGEDVPEELFSVHRQRVSIIG